MLVDFVSYSLCQQLTDRGSELVRPSIKQLEHFIAVAHWGSFRRAAEELQISQPTITAQIANVEKALSVALFERGRNGATLSPAGRRLLPIAQKVLEELDSLVISAGSARAGAAMYKLGVKSTLGPYMLPKILPSLHQMHKELRLYVREELPVQLEPQLLSGDLDLILTAFPPNSAALAGEQLLREDIKVVLPKDHPLAEKPVLQRDDLIGQKVLTTEDGHFFTRQVEQFATRMGAEILRDYRGTSLDALRVMVVMGMGIAFLPALYIHSEIRQDDSLVIRDIEGEKIARILGLAWRANSPARLFYRQLAKDMRKLLGREFTDIVQLMDQVL